jgi:hypothetical protein
MAGGILDTGCGENFEELWQFTGLEFSLEIFKPEEGRVLFMGRDIIGCEPHRVTRLVVVKTFLVDGKSSMSSRLFR